MATSWDAYERWNNAIADAAFGASAAGQPVYLDLEGEVLEASGHLAGVEGEPRRALIEAVRSTIHPPDPLASLRNHLHRLQRWADTTGGEPPPVIALLAVLSLAAEDMQAGDGLAANNYYDRLMPLLGIDVARKDSVISWYRKHSFDLWESLNGWLEALRGERGLPTAYSYSHAHIGRPLSQALIRATDRERLEELFIDQGLEPHARLAPYDMEALLADWMSQESSAASHHMRAIWSSSRERMTEITCQLLEDWEPSAEALARRRGAGAGGSSSSAVRLVVMNRAFPPSVELDLVGSGPHSAGVEVTTLDDGGQEVRIRLDAQSLGDGRWRLGPQAAIDATSLLEGILHISLEGGGELTRRPRRVVPLKQDALMRCFVEVERLGLGEDGRVMARAELAPILEDALTQVARPGFRQSERKGLPAGWCTFEDVQIVAPLHSVTPMNATAWPVDLQVLQPLATIQTTLAGGLQLPGRLRRWSTLAPPELRVIAEDAESIHIEVERVGVFRANERLVTESFSGGTALLPLGDLILPDGDYEIDTKVLAPGGKRRASGTSRLRLRSGDAPSPQRPDGQLHHLMGDPSAVLTAGDQHDGAPGIRGLAVPAPEHIDRIAPPPPSGTPSWWSARQEPRSQDERDTSRVRLPEAEPTDCFKTGAHVISLPTWFGGRQPGTIEGACKHCGLVKRYPARFRPKSKKAKTKAVLPPTFVAENTPAVVTDIDADVNTVFDALCHDGSGPASWLEQLALQVEASALYVDRMTRNLEALGHIDVLRSESSLTPMEWQVSPTTLAEVATGFVLAGHRSRSLVEAVAAAAELAGVEIVTTSQGQAAPDRIFLKTKEEGQAEHIALVAMERTKVDIEVVTSTTARLLAALAPLSEVAATRPRAPLPSSRLIKRWDGTRCRWRSCDDAYSRGDYQLIGAGVVYCRRDEQDVAEGTITRLDARLVKHVAALAAGESLVGYDADACVLYVPLGADLPSMYARAAVSASGRLPEEDLTQGLLVYRSISPEVAGRLAHLLQTGGPNDPHPGHDL